MKPPRALTILAACAVALIPATASAATTPTTYTKTYAGYYDNAPTAGGLIDATVNLPYFSSLAKVTNGITSEIRLSSSVGEWDMQLGANPQTATGYQIKMELGSKAMNCGGSSFPQGDTVTVNVAINYDSNDYPTLDFYAYDSSGNSAYCGGFVTRAWPGPSYSKVAFVGAYNAKTFHAPSSPVMLASFSNIDMGVGLGGTAITSYPHGQYIATTTGTRTGTVRAKPSALNSSGNAFTVTIP